MGDSFMILFPADPLRPKPDWPRLRGQLLENGFLRDPKLRHIGYDVVHDLWRRILDDRGQRHRPAPVRLAGLDTLLDDLRDQEIVPSSFTLDCARLSVVDFIAALRQHRYILPSFVFPQQESFSPGTLYWEFSSMKEPSDAVSWEMEIHFADYGKLMSVGCGEGLFAPPGIPGTDRVCAEWQELMDRWHLDPSQKWIDPETGKGYGILDLDWDNTLGAGRCMLEIHSPAYLDGNRAAALLTELTGQSFRWANYRL
jgi:hypothetical protein